jgi:hypothetical protein
MYVGSASSCVSISTKVDSKFCGGNLTNSICYRMRIMITSKMHGMTISNAETIKERLQ